eukprot:COSAG02_NODE_25350_length_661_cov_0.918149_1_plen_71_part_10
MACAAMGPPASVTRSRSFNASGGRVRNCAGRKWRGGVRGGGVQPDVVRAVGGGRGSAYAILLLMLLLQLLL